MFILRYLTVLLLWYNPHYTYPISYTAPIFDIDIDTNIDFDSESLISIAKSRRNEMQSEIVRLDWVRGGGGVGGDPAKIADYI